jgi:RNA polymerase sigma factor (sigma-70 family)
MQVRQSIIDLFSMFLLFEADRFQRWAIDPTLRRSMQQRSEQLQDHPASEQFWSTYWHKRWLTAANSADAKPLHRTSRDASTRSVGAALLPVAAQALAESHLSAYLQEPCYWAAQKLLTRIAYPACKLSDCFQMAIVEVPKILRACDPNQRTSLKTYSSVAFGNIIRDGLRQRQEIDLCNDWALLLKLSRKRLQAALQQAGLSSDTIARDLLAWSCFEAGYIANQSGRQICRPDADTWQAIVQRYNQQRLPHLPECSPDTLETWLLNCANRARAYLYPSVASLNTPKFEGAGEWQADLSDSQDSPLTQLIAQEDLKTRQFQQTQVSEVLKAALVQLDASAETLLRLYYQQGLTQQQIAKQLEIQQYSVSRRLARARENLLLALTRWSQETLHITPTSNVVKHISTGLEEWLQNYYSDPGSPAAKENAE